MGNAKPWQLVLIVVGLLVCGASIAYFTFGGKKVHMGTRIDLVDVTSGDRWWVDVSGNRQGVFPAKNPETGKRTLVRAFEENGVWKSTEISSAAGFADPKTFTAVESFDSGILKLSEAPVREYKFGG